MEWSEFIVKVLQEHHGMPLTGREIWELGRRYHGTLKSVSADPRESMVEMHFKLNEECSKRDSIINVIDGNPRRYTIKRDVGVYGDASEQVRVREMSWKEFIVKVMNEHPGVPLTPREIWEWGEKYHGLVLNGKTSRRPVNNVHSTLLIATSSRTPIAMEVGDKPKRYVLRKYDASRDDQKASGHGNDKQGDIQDYEYQDAKPSVAHAIEDDEARSGTYSVDWGEIENTHASARYQSDATQGYAHAETNRRRNVLSRGKRYGFLEKDLHPLLSTFLSVNTNFSCHSKTIDHTQSIRNEKGRSEWLYPDMVGVKYPFSDFDDKSLDFFSKCYELVFKLFSFEVKRELSVSNLREHYFQAISNSSWAHEGYLVVSDVGYEEDVTEELRRLNNAFGIGLIKINTRNVHDSQVLFPARTKSNLDIFTINTLVKRNPEFKSMIDIIHLSMNSGRVVDQNFYDKVLGDVQLKLAHDRLTN